MKTQFIDGKALRGKIAAPKGEKGPSDLRTPSAMERALSASFEAVVAMPVPFLSDEQEMIFTLPLSPFGLNTWEHWTKRQGITKRYHDCLETLAMLGRLPPQPPQPWERAIITATCYTRGENDLDNLIGRTKPASDFLVKAGYLSDDSPRHLTWGAMPIQIVDRKKPAYLVLTLKRAEVGQEGT